MVTVASGSAALMARAFLMAVGQPMVQQPRCSLRELTHWIMTTCFAPPTMLPVGSPPGAAENASRRRCSSSSCVTTSGPLP